jgi:hypothetical protein
MIKGFQVNSIDDQQRDLVCSCGGLLRFETPILLDMIGEIMRIIL